MFTNQKRCVSVFDIITAFTAIYEIFMLSYCSCIAEGESIPISVINECIPYLEATDTSVKLGNVLIEIQKENESDKEIENKTIIKLKKALKMIGFTFTLTEEEKHISAEVIKWYFKAAQLGHKTAMEAIR